MALRFVCFWLLWMATLAMMLMLGVATKKGAVEVAFGSGWTILILYVVGRLLKWWTA